MSQLKRLNRHHVGLVAIAVAMLALLAPTGAAQENEAEIDVDFSEDGLSFNVTSDKDISHVTVEDCEGATHKHDNLDGLYFNHTEAFVVAAVIVKSGITDERFENPNAEELCEGDLECPEMELNATANADGSISLNWTDVGDAADEYNIYRAADGGDLVFLAATSNTTYDDETTTIGVSYTYAITIVKDGRESEICARAQATAIPFFGAPLLTALALVGSVGAFVALRRRK